MRKQFINLVLILGFYLCAEHVFAQSTDPLGNPKKDNPQNVKQPGGELKVTLAGKAGGNITKKEFHEAKQLVVVAPDGDSTWQVTAYKGTCAGKGMYYQEFSMKTGDIPQQLDSMVQNAPSGAKIYFEYISVMKKGNKSIRPLSPVTFIVAD